MSSSSRPRFRNQLAKHLKKQTSVSVRKGSVFSGKRKIFSEEENVGFQVLGKRVIDSSSDDESGFVVLGGNGVKNASFSRNVSVSRFGMSNVVKGKKRKPVSASFHSEDEGVFAFSGRKIVRKGSCSKRTNFSRLRPPFVSNVVKSKETMPIVVGSSSSSSDDDDYCRFEVLGEGIVNNGSRSKNVSYSRFRAPLVSDKVRDKNNGPVSSSSSSEGDDDECGFKVLGKGIGNNGSQSKNASYSRSRAPLVSNKVRGKSNKPASSSSEGDVDECRFKVVGKGVGNNGSRSKNASYSRSRAPLVSNNVRDKNNGPVSSRFRAPLVSNKVRGSSSSSSEDGDECRFKVLGKGIENRGSRSKIASYSKSRAPLVSNNVRDKNNEPVSSRFKIPLVPNKVRGKSTKPATSSFSSEGDDADEDCGFKVLGKGIGNNGSRLKNASNSRSRAPLVSNNVRDKNNEPVSSRLKIPLVSNKVGRKNTKPASSSSSSTDDDNEGGFGEMIVRSGTCLKKTSDLRSRTPSVSIVVRDKNTGPVHSVGVINTHGFVENMCEDSDKSVDLFDKKKDEVDISSDEEEKKDEIELSSDEEEEKDAAGMESGEDEDDEMKSEEEEALFSSGDDDSMDDPYSPSDNDLPSDNSDVEEKLLRSRTKCKTVNQDNDFAVGQNKNKSDIGTGSEQNKKNDVVLEKKCEKVNLKKDVAVERNKNKGRIGTGGEQNKENDVVVEKLLRSGNKCKISNQERDFAVKLCKHEKYKGIEVMVDFDDSGDEKERRSKFEEKDPQVGKSEPPQPVMECIVRNDYKFNSSKQECCNDGDKGKRFFKVQMKDPQVGAFAQLKPVIEWEAPRDDESNSSKQECNYEDKYSCKAEGTELRKISPRNPELITILLDAVNEARSVEESVPILEPLPLKFRFEDEVSNPPPEQTEWDEEIESLFLELNYCLRMIEIESANVSKNTNVDTTSEVVDESPAASCGRGVHDPVLDEQIGNVCRFCGAILLEIKDVLPSWYTPHSK